MLLQYTLSMREVLNLQLRLIEEQLIHRHSHEMDYHISKIQPNLYFEKSLSYLSHNDFKRLQS